MNTTQMEVEEAIRRIAELRAQRKLEDAVKAADRLILMDGECAQAYRSRALLYFDLKMHSEALNDMATLVQLLPMSPAPYFERAALNMELGRNAEVIDDMKTVIEFNEPFFLQSAYLYRAIASLNLGDRSDAIACCDKLPAGYGTYALTSLGKGAFVTREELVRLAKE